MSNRLGLTRLNYKKDARGNPLPATGFELTAREWACLGELVLGQGSYRGRQIVPPPSVARSVFRFASKPVVRPHILVESAGAGWARGRHGTHAGFAMAKCAMEQCLHLQGRPRRHGRGTWLGLSTIVRYSFAEGDHCAARIKRKIFRRAFPASRAGPHSVNRYAGLTYLLSGKRSDVDETKLAGRAGHSLRFSTTGRKRV